MYGFTFFENTNRSEEFIKKYVKSLEVINPFDRKKLTYNNEVIGNFTLISFKPKDKNSKNLLHIFEKEGIVCIFWGELYRTNINPAKVVVTSFFDKGEIINFNGNYSFILYSLTKNSLLVSQDFMGRRRLYFSESKVVFSSHDTFVSPFLENLKINITSLTSSLLLDWSINKESLIEGINITQHDKILEYDDAKFTYQDKRALELSKVTTEEQVITEFERYIDYTIKDVESIDVDLTAGIDSRTVLALLLNKNISINCNTLGNLSYDAIAAKKICKKLNLKLINTSLKYNDYKSFSKHSKYLAFCCNGDTSSLRALEQIETNVSKQKLKLIGVFGTLFLGKNVQNLGVDDLINQKKAQISKFDFIPTVTRKLVLEKLKNQLLCYQDNYKDKFEEIFYYRERCGVWGSMISNSYWNLRHKTPFEDIDALAKMMSLSKKKKYSCSIQYNVLKNRSLFLYFYRINRNIFRNGMFKNINNYLRSFLIKATDKINYEIDKILKKKDTNFDIERCNFIVENNYHNKIKTEIANSNLLENNEVKKISTQLLCSEYKDRANLHMLMKLLTMSKWYDLNLKLISEMKKT